MENIINKEDSKYDFIKLLKYEIDNEGGINFYPYPTSQLKEITKEQFKLLREYYNYPDDKDFFKIL